MLALVHVFRRGLGELPVDLAFRFKDQITLFALLSRNCEEIRRTGGVKSMCYMLNKVSYTVLVCSLSCFVWLFGRFPFDRLEPKCRSVIF